MDREGAKETSVTLQVFRGQGDGGGHNERGSTLSKISQKGSSHGERDLSSLRRMWSGGSPASGGRVKLGLLGSEPTCRVPSERRSCPFQREQAERVSSG